MGDWKKRGLVLCIFGIVFLVAISLVIAEEAKTTAESAVGEAEQAVSDEDIGKVSFDTNAGITPDSTFYFLEKDVLSKFRSDISNREKKIAEIRKMIQKGDIPSAKKALEEYKLYAERVEKDVDPAKQLEARKSAEAIRNAIKEIEQEIPKSDRSEFVDGIVDKENKITLAAKVANQIEELCKSLSKLDPQQYARVCKAEGDTPKWQKKLDEQLTKEQEKEAEEIFKIMSNCFKNPKTCECDKVDVASFAAMCKEKSSLAAKCEEGDKSACESFSNSEDPTDLLPAYLQNVMAQVQKEYGQAEDNLAFGKYMPEECTKAGAKNPEECRAVMFKSNAPQECIDAGLKGQMGDEKKCEEIMFKSNAPQECIDAGIKDSRECGKFMFKSNAPQECIDAGLTGESRSDEKKCQEIMKRMGADKQNMGNQKKTAGKDCKSISDAAEKMKCFEEFYNEMSGRYIEFGDKMMDQNMVDGNTGEKISAEEERQRQICKEKGMGTILEYKNGNRIVICVDKNNPSVNGGQKCPDGTCDDYEMTHPYTCPQDCGGDKRDYQQQPMQQTYMRSGSCPQGSREQCDNGRCVCISEQNQQGKNACAGKAPPCSPGPPFCDNGNWRCPSSQNQQQPMQPQQNQQQLQQPLQNQIDQPQQPALGPGAAYAPGENQPRVAPVPGTENPPAQPSQPLGDSSGGSAPSSSNGESAPSAPSGDSGGSGGSSAPASGGDSSGSGGGSAPVTGGAISGDNVFLNFYWR